MARVPRLQLALYGYSYFMGFGGTDHHVGL